MHFELHFYAKTTNTYSTGFGTYGSEYSDKDEAIKAFERNQDILEKEYKNVVLVKITKNRTKKIIEEVLCGSAFPFKHHF